MARSKKGSRRVVVGGRAYRWRLERPPYDRDAYMKSKPERIATHLIIWADSESRVRCCRFNAVRLEGAPVTSAAASAMVSIALSRGWDPDSSGPALDMADFDVGKLVTKDSIVRGILGS